MNNNSNYDELLRNQASTHALVQKLVILISGNDADKQDNGLAGRVREMETKMQDISDRSKRIKWFMAGAIAICSAAITVLQFLFKIIH